MFRNVNLYNKNIHRTVKKIRTITVIRHAEVDHQFRVSFFKNELSISENGKQEIANKLSKLPLPKVIITSPRLRCIQTTNEWVRLKGLDSLNSPKIVINHDLREIYMGELEGLHY